ncbi:MAG: helix-turn-helix domain-containing protein [Coriobacteriales bacterium]|jgi:transcriptional regulator with XRE-family HTH domain|nr:helix-turn-helix domain-containing protein [Coriobacteriales bacterium]
MLVNTIQASDIEKSASQLGESIRTWRKLLGLRAEQVAERADISLATYSKIENGHQGVSLAKFLAVIRALGLLQKLEDSIDPYESDLGRARADQHLPRRVRR